MKNNCIPLIFLLIAFGINAQTPPILTSNIPFDTDLTMPNNQGGYTDVADIELGYNNAKRMEEVQFCLAANSIVDIVMPSQTVWDNFSYDEQFLFLANAERTARAGLDYCNGDGPVLGLAFTGIEQNIDDIAQNHADFLIASQSTSASSQSSTIDQNLVIGGSGCTNVKGILDNCCHEFVSFSVSSFSNLSSSNPSDPSTIVTEGFVANAIYFMLYSGGNSTRRITLLLQDFATNNPTDRCGFTNNYGEASDEGFLGLGIAGGVPHPSTNRTHVDILILSYFDPVPQSLGCMYDCTTCDPCPIDLVENSAPIAPDLYQASNSIQSAGDVQAGPVDMVAGNFVQLNPNFEVSLGAIYHAQIDDCFFTLD